MELKALWIDETLHQEIRILAAKKELTMREVVREAVKQYEKNNK